MIIWNPPDRLGSLIETLASCRQRYHCLVDGQVEYRGESLPTGTQAEILAWISARYKVLGELWVVRHDRFRIRYIMHFTSPEMWEYVPTTKRYLVEVEGVEKVFVLEPIHEDLLGWHPERAIAWNAK
ncbi:MAG: hypothetical protein IKO72_13545 [Kiritimatiellae bacterium]|nr:hypothetical protein [Kiritimatiellia bacterium]